MPEGLTPTKIRDIMGRCEPEHTAREIIQHYTSSWGSQKIPLPRKLEDNVVAPLDINNYSDGSLKNPVGNHWAIGGGGGWGYGGPEEKNKKSRSTTKKTNS